MNDQELIAFVLKFVHDIDAIQQKYAARIMEKRTERDVADDYDAYHKELDELYQAVLTPKKRNCFHFGISYLAPFSDIAEDPECAVEREGDKAQVTALSRTGRLDYRFHLRCKEDSWRINSYQVRVRTAHRTYAWQYDSF